MLRIRQFLALTGLTAIEAIRQPICLLLATSCVLLTALVPVLNLHNFGEDGKLARDSGLAAYFVFGLFLAGYAACSSLSREMRTGTASAVLSKPVGRELFFLAKFAGIVCVILAFSICSGIATLLAERIAEKFYKAGAVRGWMLDKQTATCLVAAPFLAYLAAAFVNYRKRRPFGSVAFTFLMLSLVIVMLIASFFDVSGRPAPFDPGVEWRLIPACLLLTMALIVLAGIALAASTRFGTVPTLTISFVVFVVGLMSDFLFGRAAETSRIAAFAYRVLPNWQHFWLSDALSGGGRIPWSYVASASVYAGLYLGAVLCLGVLSFRYADMK